MSSSEASLWHSTQDGRTETCEDGTWTSPVPRDLSSQMCPPVANQVSVLAVAQQSVHLAIKADLSSIQFCSSGVPRPATQGLTAVSVPSAAEVSTEKRSSYPH